MIYTSFFAIIASTIFSLPMRLFDINVFKKAAGIKVWKAVESGRIIDVLILGQLVKLGTIGRWEGGFSLDRAVEEYLSIPVDKDLKDSNGQDVRTGFGQFHCPNGYVDYEKIPAEYLQYAGIDAIVTFKLAKHLLEACKDICQKFGVDFEALLSHEIQLKAAFALYEVSSLGMGVDVGSVESTRKKLEHKKKAALFNLASLGWQPGKGSHNKSASSLQRYRRKI